MRLSCRVLLTLFSLISQERCYKVMNITLPVLLTAFPLSPRLPSCGAAVELTPGPADYRACRADTTFPSPPPHQLQLMTAAILKIKQEMISIGDVVADREKWSRSEMQLFFHVSAGALQKRCRGMSVCTAFHVAEGPALVFVVAAPDTYCGGCPRDLGPNAAGCCLAVFCWGRVAPGHYQHMLTSARALLDDPVCV